MVDNKRNAPSRVGEEGPAKGASEVASTPNDDRVKYCAQASAEANNNRKYAVAYSPQPTTFAPWIALDPLTWPELVEWLALDQPACRKETFGYVLGQLSGAVRKASTVVSRSALSLDADGAGRTLLEDARRVLGDGTAWAYHTTYRSTPQAPRYRLVVPLSRDVTPDEYRHIATRVNEALAAHNMDAGAAQPERLMYAPGTQDKDAYEHGSTLGVPLDVDTWLVDYVEAVPAEPREHASSAVVEPLTAAERLPLDPYAARVIEDELARLDACESLGWAGEPWDSTTYAVACNLIEMANSPWSGYTLERAEADLMQRAPTDANFGPREHAAKWRSARNKVGDEGRPNPHSTAAEDFGLLADREASLPSAPTDVPAQDEPGGWVPIDVAALLAGRLEKLSPTLLPRDDGACLLYAGRTHSLAGESGSGKSWVAQWVAAQVLEQASVLYLDYESSPAAVVNRLKLLGATDEQLRERLVYVNPDAAPSGPQFEALLSQRYGYAVVDGVTEALATSGLKGDNLTNNNDAVTQWHASLPKRIARQTGAAVLQVDHVTKAKDNRGGYAIGGQAKRAAITGAAYLVRAREPLGRGRSGWLELYVSKDREGYVDGAAAGERTEAGALVANVHAHSQPDGAMTVEVRAPVAVTEEDRAEDMKCRVVRWLAEYDAPEGVTKRTFKSAGLGNREAVMHAVEALIASGHIEVRPGPRNAQLHTLARPYAPELLEAD